MSKTSSYKKDNCYNPQCINEGAPADYNNPRCYLDPDSDKKIFCSPECGSHYLDNIDEIEKDNRLIKKIKTRRSRKKNKKEELLEAIHFYSGKSFKKGTIAKIIEKLDLSSPYI